MIFGGVAGIDAGRSILNKLGRKDLAEECHKEKDAFLASIDKSIEKVQEEQNISTIPSSPFRRMDSSAAGNLVASYPLKIYGSGDKRIKDTAAYLVRKYFLNGLFFHEIAHSGLNIYLSLEIAQVLLRSGDKSYFDIMEAVADMASDTGQWPEAIHPWTKGGCMGDGQHLWASSEWIMMIRNCFVREEGDMLILCSGVPDKWIAIDEETSFGPSSTSFGDVSITAYRSGNELKVNIGADWRGKEPRVEVRMPGYKTVLLAAGASSAVLKRI